MSPTSFGRFPRRRYVRSAVTWPPWRDATRRDASSGSPRLQRLLLSPQSKHVSRGCCAIRVVLYKVSEKIFIWCTFFLFQAAGIYLFKKNHVATWNATVCCSASLSRDMKAGVRLFARLGDPERSAPRLQAALPAASRDFFVLVVFI